MEVLPEVVPPPGIGGVGFGSSPYFATDHTFDVLCLPSVRGMGMSMPWRTKRTFGASACSLTGSAATTFLRRQLLLPGSS